MTMDHSSRWCMAVVRGLLPQLIEFADCRSASTIADDPSRSYRRVQSTLNIYLRLHFPFKLVCFHRCSPTTTPCPGYDVAVIPVMGHLRADPADLHHACDAWRSRAAVLGSLLADAHALQDPARFAWCSSRSRRSRAYGLGDAGGSQTVRHRRRSVNSDAQSLVWQDMAGLTIGAAAPLREAVTPACVSIPARTPRAGSPTCRTGGYPAP